MKKSRKEFILRAHKEACSDWKRNIESEFPKLFKKDELEVGKWYKLLGHDFLINYCKSHKNGGFIGFGFNNGRYENDNLNWCDLEDLKDLIPATDEEVKEALIKEAKRIGFKAGVSVISAHSGHKFVIDTKCSFEFNKNYFDNELYVTCDNGTYAVLMKEGKWATIVETITKEEAEKQLGKIIE